MSTIKITVLGAMGTERFSLAGPQFRFAQWPLRTLGGQIQVEQRIHDAAAQLEAAQAALRGWPLMLTVRRCAGFNVPLGRASMLLASALLDLRDPARCAVWLTQTADGSSLVTPARPGSLSIADLLDPMRRWQAQRVLEADGYQGLANRLENSANVINDFPLTIQEVLDGAHADEIAAWLDSQICATCGPRQDKTRATAEQRLEDYYRRDR